MRAHLGAVLRDFAASQTQAAQRRSAGADAEAAHLARLSVRRRLARAGTAIGVVVVVLVLAGGVVYGVTRPEPEPPATPAPVSPTVEPTAAPTLAPIPDFDPDPDDGVTVHPLLPDAQPLEPGMLADAGPGWSLVAYQGTCGYPCAYPTSPWVLYLLSPEGRRWEVPTSFQPSGLVDWLPGSSRALFIQSSREVWTSGARVVDLESGELLAEFDVEADSYVTLGQDDDVYVTIAGDEPQLRRVSYSGQVLARSSGWYGPFLWSEDREYVLQQRSGSPVVLRAEDLEVIDIVDVMGRRDRDLHYRDQVFKDFVVRPTCDAIGWTGPDELLMVCEGLVLDPTGYYDGVVAEGFVVRTSLSGTASGVGWHPEEWRGARALWRLGDRLLTEVVGQEWAITLVEVTREGQFVPLDIDLRGIAISGVTGDHLVATVHAPETGSASVLLINPFTGASQVLLAPVPGSLGSAEVVATQGVES